LDEEKRRGKYTFRQSYAHIVGVAGERSLAVAVAMIVGEIRELFDRQPGNDVDRNSLCLSLPSCVLYVCVFVCLSVCFLASVELVP